ncbi:MAG TPA: RagB/SusD family nutrient uptake outer membrane protein [Prolixibacteraceae bacterium]|nr:RagB/SusD family nutrient uptake outer membrane protein [Prolixibacteraceae bacterium]
MKIKLLILIVAIFSFISCNDIFDVSPQDKISENDVWEDESLIRLYMNACYTSAFEQGLFRTTQIGHATDELHSIKGSVYYYLITRNELTADNISTIHSYLNNWKTAYALIRNVNIFFDKIESAPITESVKQGMIGEMTFIRAFLYSQLIWRYGGVPLIKNVYGLEDDYTVKRDSYDDCVSYILAELNKAISALPNQQTGNNLGKVSADAARALKARVLLYAASPLNNPTNDKAKWQAASDAAKELIDTRYSLNDDYRSTFIAQNNEVIFAKYHTQASQLALSQQVGRNGDHGWGSDSPTQNLVNDYEMSNGQMPFLADGSVNMASGYDAAKPYANRDPRFSASILYNGSVWMGRATETFSGGADSREGPIDNWNGSMTGYYLKKFVPEDIPPTGGTIYPTTPWIMFRYAEILLNYAEAQFMLGNEEVARTYINKVRDRASVKMPAITETGEALKKRIQHERRIELVFEGHRYFDVRRWKIANETETKNIVGVTIAKKSNGEFTFTPKNLITRTWNDKLYLLPIPRTEIDRSLGSLTQNNGYN